MALSARGRAAEIRHALVDLLLRELRARLLDQRRVMPAARGVIEHREGARDVAGCGGALRLVEHRVLALRADLRDQERHARVIGADGVRLLRERLRVIQVALRSAASASDTSRRSSARGHSRRADRARCGAAPHGTDPRRWRPAAPESPARVRDRRARADPRGSHRPRWEQLSARPAPVRAVVGEHARRPTQAVRRGRRARGEQPPFRAARGAGEHAGAPRAAVPLARVGATPPRQTAARAARRPVCAGNDEPNRP